MDLLKRYAEKSFKIILIVLLFGILILLSQHPSRNSPLLDIQPERAHFNAEIHEVYQKTNSYLDFHARNSFITLKPLKVHIPSETERLRNLSSEELGQLVIKNCGMVNQNQAVTNKEAYDHAISLVGPNRLRKRYRETAILSSDGKILVYCLNTKSGSTFLEEKLLKYGNPTLINNVANKTLETTFMVIREPMHRLLSAYLDKFKECNKDNRTHICGPWKSFAQNIAQFIKQENKTRSNLFNISVNAVEAYHVSFADFVTYIIHMYLSNNGRIMDPETNIPTYFWTWEHWQSIVQDSCHPCSALWKRVVLFENFEKHIKEVFSVYPDLVRDPQLLQNIKPSNTSGKLSQYFAEITDDQLWFFGNVMYKLDYTILPYDFSDFCRTIERSLPMKHV